MATTTDTLDAKANQVARNVANKAQDFGNMVENTSQNFGRKIGSAMTDATDRAAEYVDTTRDYVKGNPIQSVVVAAATGVVVGSLLTMAASRGRH